MGQNSGIFIEITDSMREDFVVSFILKTGAREDTVRRSDLRAAYVDWLSQEYGRYHHGIDSREARKLYLAMEELLGEIEDSVDAEGKQVFVGIVLHRPSDSSQPGVLRVAEAFGNNLKFSYLEGYKRGFAGQEFETSGIPPDGTQLSGIVYYQGWCDGKEDAADRGDWTS